MSKPLDELFGFGKPKKIATCQRSSGKVEKFNVATESGLADYQSCMRAAKDRAARAAEFEDVRKAQARKWASRMEGLSAKLAQVIEAEAPGIPQDVLDFIDRIQATIQKHGGHATVKPDTSFGGKDIVITTTVLPPGAQKNGIIQNDPAYQQVWMHGAFDGGKLSDSLKVEMSVGGKLVGPNYSKPEKIGWRNVTGTPQKVIAHLDKYYAKLAQMVAARDDIKTEGTMSLVDRLIESIKAKSSGNVVASGLDRYEDEITRILVDVADQAVGQGIERVSSFLSKRGVDVGEGDSAVEKYVRDSMSDMVKEW